MTILANFLILVWTALSSMTLYKKYANVVIVTFLSALIALNRGNQDFENYVEIFSSPNGYAEPGYYILIEIVKFLGGNRHEIILFVLAMFLFYVFTKLNSEIKNFGLVLSLYFIFPFPVDVVQIRNTFLFLFLINSLIEYLKGKHSWAVVNLILGCSFHYLGAIFLLLAFFLNFKKSKIFTVLVPVASLSTALFGGSVLSIVTDFLQIRNLESYIVDITKFRSPLVWGGSLLIDYLILKIFYDKVVKMSVKPFDMHLIETLIFILYAGFIFIGVLFHLDEFGRVFRMLFFAKYLLCSVMICYLSRRDKLILLLYFLTSSLAFSIYYNFTMASDDVLFNLGWF